MRLASVREERSMLRCFKMFTQQVDLSHGWCQDAGMSIRIAPREGGHFLFDGLGGHIFGIDQERVPSLHASFNVALVSDGRRMDYFHEGMAIRSYVKWEPPPPVMNEDGEEEHGGEQDPNYLWLFTPFMVGAETLVEVKLTAPTTDGARFCFTLMGYEFFPGAL